MKSTLIIFLVFAAACLMAGQTQPSTVTTPVSAPRLLAAVGLPIQAVDFRRALPGIFDVAGHERRTLSGVVSASSGGDAIPFVFTRELDQEVRLDLGTRSLVTTGLNTISTPQSRATGSGSQSIDDDIFEVLAEDGPEALLFSFGTAARIRWFGQSYRTDSGKSEYYSGPYYDIYAKTAVAGTKPGIPERVKVFLFDSGTKLLSLTRYQVQRDGSAIEVEISFNGWISISGQMVPTTIVRSENGQQVFCITINAAASSATQVDSLFTL